MVEKELEEGWKRETWLCLGKRQAAKGAKTVIGFRLVQPDYELGPEFWYEAKSFKIGRPGYVYTIEVSEDGQRIRPGTLQYQRPWNDDAYRLQLETEERVYEAQKRVKSLMEKETSQNLLRETLEPLRKAYWETDFYGRLAMEALVLHYLRYGDPKKK